MNKTMLKQGIYEQVINTEIAVESSLSEREGYFPDKAHIVSPESSRILADYVADIIKQQLGRGLRLCDGKECLTVLEGSKYLQDKGVDILFITLNKSAKDYSPTTMYNDYSINEMLFHWQSQIGTSVTSPTGLRYINQRTRGNKILLFVRDTKKYKVLGTADSYTYLDSVEYVEHRSSQPINITWKLSKAIPAKFYKKSNKLMVI